MGDSRQQGAVGISIDGEAVTVSAGTTVAAAVWNHGIRRFRVGVAGSGRAPLCGMGVCYECRLTIDGEVGQRSCMLPCRQGMTIVTAATNKTEGTEQTGEARHV